MTTTQNGEGDLERRVRALRAPHIATGAVVEAAGSNVARAVYAMFQVFNAQFFGGALAAPLVLITQAGSTRTLGDYVSRDVHGLESRIRIAPMVIKRGLAFTYDVLLHEMTHAWQHEIDRHSEAGYRGHGPRFAAKCNEIGAALGLPPVGVKGRDGLPDCAHWPLNVRPAGYYPSPFVARKRTPRTRAQTQETHGNQPSTASGSISSDDRLRAFVRELDTRLLEQLSHAIAEEMVARATRSRGA